MAAPDAGGTGCTPVTIDQAQAQSRYWSLIPFAIAAIIVLLAVALRLRGISLESLDGDEAFSYRVASSDLTTAFSMVRNDLVHPPLYYFLLHMWLSLTAHPSPLVLRVVSLSAGFATVGLIACIGWLFERFRSAAFIAACLLATNNLHIFYSQQIRSYSFYTLLFACLLVWSWQIFRYAEKTAFWCAGAILMSLLVYTHYVGALYVTCIIVAVILSPAARRAKRLILVSGFIAACSFIPWILAEIAPSRAHHGTQDNLSWESAPNLYDLKAIWAAYLGMLNFHAATTIVVTLGFALAAFSLFYGYSERNSLSRLVLTTLALTAFIPPSLLFLLSLKPVSLPIFGERHLLPSIVSYLLLVADGLIQLANNFRVRTAVLVPGVTLLLIFELVPTVTATSAGPRRMPFQAIVSATQGSIPLYTTWPYGIGAVMNVYEHDRNAVLGVPSDVNRLPDKFILIFRPGIPKEERKFENLLKSRWQAAGNRDFYNGLHGGYYVRVAKLQRVPPMQNSGLESYPGS